VALLFSVVNSPGPPPSRADHPIAKLSPARDRLDGKAYAKNSSRTRHPRGAAQPAGPPILATICPATTLRHLRPYESQRLPPRRHGILSITLPNATNTAELLAAIDDLNANPASAASSSSIPSQTDRRARLLRPHRSREDVDGSPPTASAHGHGEPAYGSPHPPASCVFSAAIRSPRGREAVASNAAPHPRPPMAMMLLAANATVTIWPSRTKNFLKSSAARIVSAQSASRNSSVATGSATGRRRRRRLSSRRALGDISFPPHRPLLAYTPVPGGFLHLTHRLTVPDAAKKLRVPRDSSATLTNCSCRLPDARPITEPPTVLTMNAL